MQDNASIYTAKIVREWLEEMGVTTMDWPPYSPDLNPIEHLWFFIKEWVHDHHLKLLELPKNDETVKDALFKAISEAWQAIPDELLTKLIESMPKR